MKTKNKMKIQEITKKELDTESQKRFDIDFFKIGIKWKIEILNALDSDIYLNLNSKGDKICLFTDLETTSLIKGIPKWVMSKVGDSRINPITDIWEDFTNEYSINRMYKTVRREIEGKREELVAELRKAVRNIESNCK